MINIYGIKNCDTMKKAFTWLEAHGVEYTFHDYKKVGADVAKLKAWAAQVGWEKLINTRGPTFRKLAPEKQANLTEAKAYALMVENTSMIKRPIVEAGEKLLVGFDAVEYEKVIG